jgi:hypothetical protein
MHLAKVAKSLWSLDTHSLSLPRMIARRGENGETRFGALIRRLHSLPIKWFMKKRSFLDLVMTNCAGPRIHGAAI